MAQRTLKSRQRKSTSLYTFRFRRNVHGTHAMKRRFRESLLITISVPHIPFYWSSAKTFDAFGHAFLMIVGGTHPGHLRDSSKERILEMNQPRVTWSASCSPRWHTHWKRTINARWISPNTTADPANPSVIPDTRRLVRAVKFLFWLPKSRHVSRRTRESTAATSVTIWVGNIKL